MALLEISSQNALYYEHRPPSEASGYTFVFFNALTGDTQTWEGAIAPALREAGHGTLSYNLRGQTDSPFAPDTTLSAALVVEDALQLLAAIKPTQPILVGLSIGGLFAAQAWLQGAPGSGLVLINTLRRDGPRLQWIGDALVRAVEIGGLGLFRDLFLPLLVNDGWLNDNRGGFLLDTPDYQPLDKQSGTYKLLAEAGRSADWAIDYHALVLPTLVITGLQDHVFLEPDVVSELSAQLPHAQRIDMPDAGHLIPMERPEALTTHLLNFAKEI